MDSSHEHASGTELEQVHESVERASGRKMRAKGTREDVEEQAKKKERSKQRNLQVLPERGRCDTRPLVAEYAKKPPFFLPCGSFVTQWDKQSGCIVLDFGNDSGRLAEGAFRSDTHALWLNCDEQQENFVERFSVPINETYQLKSLSTDVANTQLDQRSCLSNSTTKVLHCVRTMHEQTELDLMEGKHYKKVFLGLHRTSSEHLQAMDAGAGAFAECVAAFGPACAVAQFCAPGSYQPTHAQDACLPCPADHYQDEHCATACRQCPVNTQAPPGAAAPAACVASTGFFGTPGSAVAPCAPGAFSELPHSPPASRAQPASTSRRSPRPPAPPAPPRARIPKARPPPMPVSASQGTSARTRTLSAQAAPPFAAARARRAPSPRSRARAPAPRARRASTSPRAGECLPRLPARHLRGRGRAGLRAVRRRRGRARALGPRREPLPRRLRAQRLAARARRRAPAAVSPAKPRCRHRRGHRLPPVPPGLLARPRRELRARARRPRGRSRCESCPRGSATFSLS
jgi:hypothetical protein